MPDDTGQYEKRLLETLETVLASRDFSRAPKTCRLLEVMVRKSLEKGGEITQYTLAEAMYGSPGEGDRLRRALADAERVFRKRGQRDR